jgi:hypothetical protein
MIMASSIATPWFGSLYYVYQRPDAQARGGALQKIASESLAAR